MLPLPCAIALIFVAMLVAAAPAQAPAADGASDEAVGAARRFFAEPDAAKRKDLAAAFGKLWPEGRRPKDLSAVLRRAAVFPEIGFGVHAFEAPAEGPVPAVKYIVSVPEGYKADSADGWPLVVGLHGTGGTGAKFLRSLAAWLGDDLGTYLVACPDAPDGGQYAFSEVATVYPRMVLNDVRRRLNVDSDRVILTGYSKGGYATWATVLFSPGEWAGAAPMACFPLTEAGRHGIPLYLENVVTVGVQYHWGDRDMLPGQEEGINTFGRAAADEMARLKATKFEPVEYKGQGHGLKIDTAKLRAFLAAARRDAWPDPWRMAFHKIWEGYGPNVRAVRWARTELDFKNLPPVRVADESQVKTALMKLFRDRAYQLRADVVASTNSLVVRAKNLREIEILLSPQQLDFSKPVRVVVNGKPVGQKKLTVDWPLLLETVRTTGDFTRLVAARIGYTLPR